MSHVCVCVCVCVCVTCWISEWWKCWFLEAILLVPKDNETILWMKALQFTSYMHVTSLIFLLQKPELWLLTSGRIVMISHRSFIKLIQPQTIQLRTLANEITPSIPVKDDEVVKFLDKKKIPYKKGYACITTGCPKWSQSKAKLKHSDQLSINTTSG